MDALPETLLPTVAWDFARPRYVSLAGFLKVATAAQTEAFHTEDHWAPETREVKRQFIRVELKRGRLERRVVTLKSDRPEGFTTAELLFKLHTAFHADLKWGGACLQSLTLDPEDGHGLLPPLYLLRVSGTLARRIDCVACAMARTTGSHVAVQPDWHPEGAIAEDFYAA